MSEFSEYVTSTAFNLNLSKSMVSMILLMNYVEQANEDTSLAIVSSGFYNANTLKSLRSRGLIEWRTEKVPENKKKPFGPHTEDTTMTGPFVTEPGKVVCQLLEMAGFSCGIDTGKKEAA